MNCRNKIDWHNLFKEILAKHQSSQSPLRQSGQHQCSNSHGNKWAVDYILYSITKKLKGRPTIVQLVEWVNFAGQQKRSSNKPSWMKQEKSAPAPALSPTTPSWSSPSHDKYPQFPSPTKSFPSTTQSFSPPYQPVHERLSILQQHADLIASYPAPREKRPPPAELTGLIKPTSSSAPKPGAGYSYQGIV